MDDVFTSDTLITLGPILLPPITWAMSTIAMVETARREGDLDRDALRELSDIHLGRDATTLPVGVGGGGGERGIPVDELALAVTGGVVEGLPKPSE